jgi:hypothetical protein
MFISTERHRFIFCINSGRSGSKYLARLLGSAEGVSAFHEANPNMSGPYLRMICEKGLEATFADRRVKAHTIWQIVSRLPPGWVYAETNHMFIKTFFDVVIEAFKDHEIDVIILRRNLPQVLKSFITMGYFSEMNQVWPAWMHVPGKCNCIFQPPATGKPPDQYDLAIGYLLDIETRAQRFKLQYTSCRIHEIMLESLQTLDEVKSFFTALGLSLTAATQDMVSRSVNERTHRKAQIGIKTTLEYCGQRIQKYLHKCREQGIEVSLLPQLTL